MTWPNVAVFAWSWLYGRAAPGWRGSCWKRDGEGIQQERDKGVVPAQRHQLHHSGVTEEPLGLVVGILVKLAGLGELPGGGVDRPLVVGFEGRLLAVADGVDDRAGHAVLTGHPGMRPPLALRLPARADGDDGDLRQPSLDRGAEPELPAQRAQVPAGLRRVHEGVERPGQPPGGVHELTCPRADDAVPHRLAAGIEVVMAQVRKAAHVRTVSRRT